MGKINEEKIIELIKEYQDGNKSVLNTIIKEISLYVYNFPLIMYNRPKEEAGEFYIYFMERIENIVRNFKYKGYRFTTYLTASLINHYKNFLMTNRKTIKVIYESELNDINVLYLLNEESSSDYSQDEILQKAVNFFNQLDEFSKLIIKTFIFELSPEDLKLISKYTNKPIEKVINEYQEILVKVSKRYQKRKKLIESINQNPSPKKIEKLRKMNTLCNYSDVANLLGMTVSNVGVSLKRIRDKFKAYAYKNLSTL